jgi:hypothetical protein
VYTIPAKPTTNDSITYHFYDKNMCCGTQFVNPSVSVFDTQVYLGFSANTTPCQFVKCFVAGAGYDFKVGKLKAGKYGIYKAETFYCTTKVCPMIAIMPVRIGEVVVTTPLAIVPGDPATMPVEALVFEQGKSAINLDYLLEKQSYVRISVYNARGILAAHIYKGIASKGTHRFSWMATARGVYVMSVEVNGTQVAERKIVVSR